MKLRTGLLATVIAAMTGAAPALAEYPERAITLVVGSVPGSGPDVLARSMSEEMGAALGQPIIVENMPGAAGNVAAAAISRDTPDGYRMFIVTSNMAVATWLPKEPPFDPGTDFAFVGQVGAIPNVLVVSKDLGPKTVGEFVEFARERPGELNYSSSGVGSSLHLAMVEMMEATGIEMVHIPYKGGKDATTAVLSGEVDSFMAGMPPALPFIRSGDLVALAVSGAERAPQIPDVPTLGETIMPGYSAESWYGLLLPKGTPEDIVEKVNAAAQVALADEAVVKRFFDAGAVVKISTGAEFQALVAEQSERWKGELEKLGLAGTR
ncbi:MAG: Bug family tripartite tricarboxylate transporter substrate binding protein [Tropicimonas sp.]|uniref:Bug family tripartite tricarboxylate transporter substrate binding protein n=1 Tax=Tropicimonas sp. TaxID=2067044 RepID=UPI003A836286